MRLIDKDKLKQAITKACGSIPYVISRNGEPLYIDKLIEEQEEYNELVPTKERMPFDHPGYTLAELPKQQKEERNNWVPITERMPDGEALFSNRQGDQTVGFIAQDKESDTGYIADPSCSLLDDVTHWMEPPKPPKRKLKKRVDKTNI